MALNGNIVESKPRDARVPLEDIPADVTSTVEEVLGVCASGPYVFVKYDEAEIASIGLTGDEFLKLARDYGYAIDLTVTGSASKTGVRIRVTHKDVSA